MRSPTPTCTPQVVTKTALGKWYFPRMEFLADTEVTSVRQSYLHCLGELSVLWKMKAKPGTVRKCISLLSGSSFRYFSEHFFSFPFSNSASWWAPWSQGIYSPFVFPSNQKEHCETSPWSNLPSASGRVLTNYATTLTEAGQGACLRMKGDLHGTRRFFTDGFT